MVNAEKKTVSYSVEEYATAHGISRSAAYARLKKLVDAGQAEVFYNTIIRQGSRKVGARSKPVTIRGNKYAITLGADENLQPKI